MYKIKNNILSKNENPLVTTFGIVTNPTREILIQEGYKDLVRNIPPYNKETQRIDSVNYTEDEFNIYENYIVKDVQIEDETIEEKIARLEQELEELKQIMQ